MNAENIREWIAALRSGKYEQATGVLQTPSGRMCCLGVACEVFRQEVGAGKWLTVGDGVSCKVFSVEGSSSADRLPEPVAAWLGLSVNPELHWSDCIYENDEENRSFEEIADMLEAMYLSTEVQR